MHSPQEVSYQSMGEVNDMSEVVKLKPTVQEGAGSILSEFKRSGFVTIPATHKDKLITIRNTICNSAKKLLNIETINDDDFLNQFQTQGLAGNDLNKFRTQLITDINNNIDIGQLVYDAFEDFLNALLGPDIAVQKSTNLVIQQPGDIAVSPTHRDAPPNSMYEVVAWIPLVDCYGTKGLTVLDKDSSRTGLDLLTRSEDNNELDLLVKSKGQKAELKFGSAIFFWSALLHSVPVNIEDETRWSLNLRYKNLYSPYGGKGLDDHYKILNLSPLSQLIIDNEKQTLIHTK